MKNNISHFKLCERPCSRCPKGNGGEGTNGANAPQQEEANSSGVHGGAGLLEGH